MRGFLTSTALAVALLASAPLALPHGTPSGGSGGGPGHGDEGIGTLPSVFGGGPGRSLVSLGASAVSGGAGPQVVISGPQDRIASLFPRLAADPGTRHVERRNGRRYELVLSNVSYLRFDPALLAEAGVRVSLRFDPMYSGGAGRIHWNGSEAAMFPLLTEFELPLQRLASEGLLAGRGLAFEAAGVVPGAHAAIGLVQVDGAIVLSNLPL